VYTSTDGTRAGYSQRRSLAGVRYCNCIALERKVHTDGPQTFHLTVNDGYPIPCCMKVTAVISNDNYYRQFYRASCEEARSNACNILERSRGMVARDKANCAISRTMRDAPLPGSVQEVPMCIDRHCRLDRACLCSAVSRPADICAMMEVGP
jgi:hypothetical protein